MDIAIATLETPHYSFIATGLTVEEARDAIIEKWDKHAKETGADPDYLSRYGDIDVVIAPLGTVFRDGSPF